MAKTSQSAQAPRPKRTVTLEYHVCYRWDGHTLFNVAAVYSPDEEGKKSAIAHAQLLVATDRYVEVKVDLLEARTSNVLTLKASKDDLQEAKALGVVQ